MSNERPRFFVRPFDQRQKFHTFLTRWYAEAQRTIQCRVCVVLGSVGIGKTHAVDTWCTSTQRRPVTVNMCSVDRDGRHVLATPGSRHLVFSNVKSFDPRKRSPDLVIVDDVDELHTVLTPDTLQKVCTSSEVPVLIMLSDKYATRLTRHVCEWPSAVLCMCYPSRPFVIASWLRQQHPPQNTAEHALANRIATECGGDLRSAHLTWTFAARATVHAPHVSPYTMARTVLTTQEKVFGTVDRLTEQTDIDVVHTLVRTNYARRTCPDTLAHMDALAAASALISESDVRAFVGGDMTNTQRLSEVASVAVATCGLGDVQLTKALLGPEYDTYRDGPKVALETSTSKHVCDGQVREYGHKVMDGRVRSVFTGDLAPKRAPVQRQRARAAGLVVSKRKKKRSAPSTAPAPKRPKTVGLEGFGFRPKT